MTRSFRKISTLPTGFTLVELVIVIVIIGILATVAVRSITTAIENARFKSTSKEMSNLVWAVSGNPELISDGARSDFGYVGDTGKLPPDLNSLANDPGICGWDGPYVSNEFLDNPDDFKQDAWGESYQYTVNTSGALVVTSARAGSKAVDDTTDLLYNTVRVQLYNADGILLSSTNGSVEIEVACQWIPLTYWSTRKSFINEAIPIGTHQLRGYAAGDTTIKTITVLPSSVNSVDLYVFPTFGTLSAVGCAVVSGSGNQIVSEEINNNDSPTYTVDKLTIDWLSGTCWNCKSPYLESVSVGSKTYWGWDTNGRSSRVGTGTQIFLDSDLNLYKGSTTITLVFNKSATGTGSAINMSAADFNIKFHPTNAPVALVSFSACGSAGTPPAISYVSSSATVSGSGNHQVGLSVANNGSCTLPTSQIGLTWSDGSCWDTATPYLESVAINSTTVWQWTVGGGGNRASSGQLLTLNSTVELASGSSPVSLVFKNAATDPSSTVDMRGVNFVLTFKSSCFGDQTASFTTPGSCTPCLLTSPSGTSSGSGHSTVAVSMANLGTFGCGIVRMKITCSKNGSGVQPWVASVRNGVTTYWYWSTEGSGNCGNTTAGSETLLVLRNTLSLGSGSVSISAIEFRSAIHSGSLIDMRGVVMTIEFQITNCGGCSTPQSLTFTVN